MLMVARFKRTPLPQFFINFRDEDGLDRDREGLDLPDLPVEAEARTAVAYFGFDLGEGLGWVRGAAMNAAAGAFARRRSAPASRRATISVFVAGQL